MEELIVKYLIGDLSDEECGILQQWRDESPQNEAFFESFCKQKSFSREYREYHLYKKRSKQRFNEAWASLNPQRTVPYWSSKLLLRAAVWLLPLVIAGISYAIYNSSERIVPGTSKATLLLSNGSVMELGKSRQQNWIYVGQKFVATEHNGMISYNMPDRQTSAGYNVLSVPRGGEFQLKLSDGTLVHLNAQSELKYPIRFAGDKRVVILRGEAYFEIARDAKRPFYIETNGLLIRQYGTKFNVKSRTPESTEVALLEGSIGVMPIHGEMKMLKVGQLAVWNAVNGKLKVDNKDLFPHIAWHFNRFVFNNESLGSLLQEISLWYEVDVKFSDKSLANLHFTGSVGRNDDMSIMLRAIEETVNVQFKVSGHEILVTRK